jgi:asparagine synthase (glutamine-hydrolysing)
MVIHGDVGVASARLSLVDFDGGGQPLQSTDGGLVMVFNGEIYNHAQLRADLVRDYGSAFHGHSDTEVVLRGFEAEGRRFLTRLEGMYALAVTDGRSLWLGRDSFGIKPLFYSVIGGTRLVFASEVKALYGAGWAPNALNGEALVEFATLGFMLDDHTLFDGIRQVRPGELVKIDRTPDGTVRIVATRPPPPDVRPFDGSEDDAAEALLELLRASVREQVAADHPVGCLVSGGIDSSIVAALLDRPASTPAFTVADRPDMSGLGDAVQLARHLTLPHQTVSVEPIGFIAATAAAVSASELPVVPVMAFISAPAVRRAAKAVLIGDGADELFCGYPMHVNEEGMVSGIRARLERLEGQTVLPSFAVRSTRNLLDTLGDSGGDRRARVGRLLLEDRLANWHLWLWDRGSMASSLEARLPFLNTRVRAFAESIPVQWKIRGDATKLVLRRVLTRLLPPALADRVVSRPKTAAWDSTRTCQIALETHARTGSPRDHRRAHPFRPFLDTAVEKLLFDFFIFIFFMNDGCLPDRFDAAALYGDYLPDLVATEKRLAIH